MKPPLPIAPNPPIADPQIPATQGVSPAVLVSLGALVVLLIAGMLAGLRCGTGPAAAALATEGRWLDREERVRRLLQVAPGDERARLRLAGTLIWQAQQEAQRAYPTEWAATPADAAALETWSTEAVRHSPRLAEARGLAEEVARHGRDRRQRAAAWALLARLQRLLGSVDEGMASMAQAAREDPSYRAELAILKDPSR